LKTHLEVGLHRLAVLAFQLPVQEVKDLVVLKLRDFTAGGQEGIQISLKALKGDVLEAAPLMKVLCLSYLFSFRS